MSVEDDFYDLASGTAGVSALVGDRIYPDAMPEKTAYPAVVYSRSATDEERLLDGSVASIRYELEVNCWAKTRTAADAVGDAIGAALVGTSFCQIGRTAGYDAETGLFAAMLIIDRFY